MKVAIDTNIALDVLARREPFYEESNNVLELCATGAIEGALTANAITDIYYVLRKHLDGDMLRAALQGLMELLEVIDVTSDDCMKALDIPMPDYEDALFVCSAMRWGAECIITRDTKDFAHSPLKALSPKSYLENEHSAG